MEQTIWPATALLRPGRQVTILNLSAGGALLSATGRISVGRPTALQLLGGVKRIVSGRIERCRVMSLLPLCYECVLIFDEPLRIVAVE